MTWRRRTRWSLLAAAGLFVLLPAGSAWGHAALLRTNPQGSVTVNGSPSR